MPKKTINRRKKQSNKRNKSKKSRYSSIAKKIDKVIDSYFKKDKKKKKRKKTIKKSGTRSGPFKKNPRVELNIEKKELEVIEKDILEKSEPLIKEAKRLALDASKQTKVVADFIEQKIINDINESLRILEDDDNKENKINFLHKSLLFWKMCDKYPKTKKCLGKNAKEKIEEYMKKLNLLN